ncbi:hypothetical protein [Streptomyces xiamenensis]|uniref:hypothetical protein n=1 Tax=Streptomyces xiamenensis TaxID=408015 RepID=UPI0035E243C2
MTTTPDRLELPARRRRHARRIAALTELIGACAQAAGAVYGPIAAAPPGQDGVEVSLLSCLQVAGSAALLLDRAIEEDTARWKAAVAREQEEAARTHAARCAVAEAQDAVEPADPPGPFGVPLPTVQQAAAIDLAAAGDEVAARWRQDPAEAVALVGELVATGGFTAGEVLDQAVDAATQTGLLAITQTHEAPDPSTAAELCLNAIPHLVLAISLASADFD